MCVVAILFSTSPAIHAQTIVEKPLISRIEHFYVFAEHPEIEKLFRRFRDDFGLPEVWPYGNRGDYDSGAVTLGNVVLEFATYEDEHHRKNRRTEFQGLVFEPTINSHDADLLLTKWKVPHKPPFAESPRFDIVTFTDLPPKNVELMLCDYKDRAGIAAGRAAAARKLVDSHGGSLGIVALKEIVIGVENIAEARRKWQMAIDGTRSGPGSIVRFSSGPSVRFVREGPAGIHQILAIVRSEKAARAELKKRKMLATSKGRLSILPSAIGGLQVFLTQKP